METDDGLRVLHPLDIDAKGDVLTFALELCVPVPPLTVGGEEAAEPMKTLHFGV
jgi:hypothetical protein